MLFKNKKILQNIYVILIVALLLTLYELTMFYFNLIPVVREKVNGLFTNELILKSKNNLFLDILKTYKQREDLLLQKINYYTIIRSIILILIILLLIFIVNKYVKFDTYILKVSLFTMALLFVFQYIFYNYSISYKYIDSNSNLELFYYIIKNI